MTAASNSQLNLIARLAAMKGIATPTPKACTFQQADQIIKILNGMPTVKNINPATAGQKAFIGQIEAALGLSFKGNTFDEADSFIKGNLEAFNASKKASSLTGKVNLLVKLSSFMGNETCPEDWQAFDGESLDRWIAQLQKELKYKSEPTPEEVKETDRLQVLANDLDRLNKARHRGQEDLYQVRSWLAGLYAQLGQELEEDVWLSSSKESIKNLIKLVTAYGGFVSFEKTPFTSEEMLYFLSE